MKSLWQGPNDDGPNGGVTQSMLGQFVVCRERFRIKYVEGIQEADTFRHRLHYGQMWHAAEKGLASGGSWEKSLHDYVKKLLEQYRDQQPQVQHWYRVCACQFPVYVDFWKKHPDTASRKPLLQEQVFDTPYTLPSGRTVRLRGRWDGVDLIGKGKEQRMYLQEHKTKGDIDEGLMRKQLTFDLQTMLYLTALEQEKDLDRYKLGGIRYNVVRRPLAGGKNSIRKKEPTKTNPRGESDDEFYGRLQGLIAEDPAYYFMRWRVEILPADLERFRRECLDPLLEQLCDWWDWIVYEPVHKSNKKQYRGYELRGNDPFSGQYDCDGNYLTPQHYRTPFGIYNPLAEGGATDLDEYLVNGSTVGLSKADRLFTELEG